MTKCASGSFTGFTDGWSNPITQAYPSCANIELAWSIPPQFIPA
jgi:hypothetical protein